MEEDNIVRKEVARQLMVDVGIHVNKDVAYMEVMPKSRAMQAERERLEKESVKIKLEASAVADKTGNKYKELVKKYKHCLQTRLDIEIERFGVEGREPEQDRQVKWLGPGKAQLVKKPGEVSVWKQGKMRGVHDLGTTREEKDRMNAALTGPKPGFELEYAEMEIQRTRSIGIKACWESLHTPLMGFLAVRRDASTARLAENRVMKVKDDEFHKSRGLQTKSERNAKMRERRKRAQEVHDTDQRQSRIGSGPGPRSVDDQKKQGELMMRNTIDDRLRDPAADYTPLRRQFISAVKSLRRNKFRLPNNVNYIFASSINEHINMTAGRLMRLISGFDVVDPSLSEKDIKALDDDNTQKILYELFTGAGVNWSADHTALFPALRLAKYKFVQMVQELERSTGAKILSTSVQQSLIGDDLESVVNRDELRRQGIVVGLEYMIDLRQVFIVNTSLYVAMFQLMEKLERQLFKEKKQYADNRFGLNAKAEIQEKVTLANLRPDADAKLALQTEADIVLYHVNSENTRISLLSNFRAELRDTFQVGGIDLLALRIKIDNFKVMMEQRGFGPPEIGPAYIQMLEVLESDAADHVKAWKAHFGTVARCTARIRGVRQWLFNALERWGRGKPEKEKGRFEPASVPTLFDRSDSTLLEKNVSDFKQLMDDFAIKLGVDPDPNTMIGEINKAIVKSIFGSDRKRTLEESEGTDEEENYPDFIKCLDEYRKPFIAPPIRGINDGVFPGCKKQFDAAIEYPSHPKAWQMPGQLADDAPRPRWEQFEAFESASTNIADFYMRGEIVKMKLDTPERRKKLRDLIVAENKKGNLDRVLELEEMLAAAVTDSLTLRDYSRAQRLAQADGRIDQEPQTYVDPLMAAHVATDFTRRDTRATSTGNYIREWRNDAPDGLGVVVKAWRAKRQIDNWGFQMQQIERERSQVSESMRDHKSVTAAEYEEGAPAHEQLLKSLQETLDSLSYQHDELIQSAPFSNSGSDDAFIAARSAANAAWQTQSDRIEQTFRALAAGAAQQKDLGLLIAINGGATQTWAQVRGAGRWARELSYFTNKSIPSKRPGITDSDLTEEQLMYFTQYRDDEKALEEAARNFLGPSGAGSYRALDDNFASNENRLIAPDVPVRMQRLLLPRALGWGVGGPDDADARARALDPGNALNPDRVGPIDWGKMPENWTRWSETVQADTPDDPADQLAMLKRWGVVEESLPAEMATKQMGPAYFPVKGDSIAKPDDNAKQRQSTRSMNSETMPLGVARLKYEGTRLPFMTQAQWMMLPEDLRIDLKIQFANAEFAGDNRFPRLVYANFAYIWENLPRDYVQVLDMGMVMRRSEARKDANRMKFFLPEELRQRWAGSPQFATLEPRTGKPYIWWVVNDPINGVGHWIGLKDTDYTSNGSQIYMRPEVIAARDRAAAYLDGETPPFASENSDIMSKRAEDGLLRYDAARQLWYGTGVLSLKIKNVNVNGILYPYHVDPVERRYDRFYPIARATSREDDWGDARAMIEGIVEYIAENDGFQATLNALKQQPQMQQFAAKYNLSFDYELLRVDPQSIGGVQINPSEMLRAMITLEGFAELKGADSREAGFIKYGLRWLQVSGMLSEVGLDQPKAAVPKPELQVILNRVNEGRESDYRVLVDELPNEWFTDPTGPDRGAADGVVGTLPLAQLPPPPPGGGGGGGAGPSADDDVFMSDGDSDDDALGGNEAGGDEADGGVGPGAGEEGLPDQGQYNPNDPARANREQRYFQRPGNAALDPDAVPPAFDLQEELTGMRRERGEPSPPAQRQRVPTPPPPAPSGFTGTEENKASDFLAELERRWEERQASLKRSNPSSVPHPIIDRRNKLEILLKMETEYRQRNQDPSQPRPAPQPQLPTFLRPQLPAFLRPSNGPPPRPLYAPPPESGLSLTGGTASTQTHNAAFMKELDARLMPFHQQMMPRYLGNPVSVTNSPEFQQHWKQETAKLEQEWIDAGRNWRI